MRPGLRVSVAAWANWSFGFKVSVGHQSPDGRLLEAHHLADGEDLDEIRARSGEVYGFFVTSVAPGWR